MPKFSEDLLETVMIKNSSGVRENLVSLKYTKLRKLAAKLCALVRKINECESFDKVLRISIRKYRWESDF